MRTKPAKPKYIEISVGEWLDNLKLGELNDDFIQQVLAEINDDTIFVKIPVHKLPKSTHKN